MQDQQKYVRNTNLIYLWGRVGGSIPLVKLGSLAIAMPCTYYDTHRCVYIRPSCRASYPRAADRPKSQTTHAKSQPPTGGWATMRKSECVVSTRQVVGSFHQVSRCKVSLGCLIYVLVFLGKHVGHVANTIIDPTTMSKSKMKEDKSPTQKSGMIIPQCADVVGHHGPLSLCLSPVSGYNITSNSRFDHWWWHATRLSLAAWSGSIAAMIAASLCLSLLKQSYAGCMLKRGGGATRSRTAQCSYVRRV